MILSIPMTTEKPQDEKNTDEDNKKYTQDGITFKSKKDWENYNSTISSSDKSSSDKVVLDNNVHYKDKIDFAQTVKISDIDIPFWRVVFIMVKWAIASIPAFLILMVLFAIFGGVFVGILATFQAIF